MFVIVKPDVMVRGLDTAILLHITTVTDESLLEYSVRKLSLREAELLYQEHEKQDFYRPLVEFMMSGPVGIAKFTGLPLDRDLVDEIRRMYGRSVRENAIHASRTAEDETRETAIFV